MNDNDKAALAAGLCNPEPDVFENIAPDMHDPANLWRGIENRGLSPAPDLVDGFSMTGRWGVFDVEGNRISHEKGLAGAVFAALVALYDAEHLDESAVV